MTRRHLLEASMSGVLQTLPTPAPRSGLAASAVHTRVPAAQLPEPYTFPGIYRLRS